MQRQKVQRATQQSYPTHQGFALRRPKALMAGLLVAVVGAPGCIELGPGPNVMGDMVVPQEVYFAALPAEGSRTLYFDAPYGWIDYHVEAEVDNADLAEYLGRDVQRLLDLIDDLLAERGLAAFDGSEDLHEMELEIRQLLADSWTQSQDAPTWNFLDLALVIDDLVYEEVVDGDIGS